MSESKKLATKGEVPPVVREETQVTQQMLKDYLVGTKTKLSDSQFNMFWEIAKGFNLNPFKREIYAVAYGSEFNVITGYEVYLKRAERSGKLNGWSTEFHHIGSKQTLACTITIYRKDWEHPFKHTVLYPEFYQAHSPLWKSKPMFMLKKVAMAHGFRLCFPEECQGLPYTADELPPKMGGTPEIKLEPPEKVETPAPLPKPEKPLSERIEEKVKDMKPKHIPLDMEDEKVKELIGSISEFVKAMPDWVKEKNAFVDGTVSFNQSKEPSPMSEVQANKLMDMGKSHLVSQEVKTKITQAITSGETGSQKASTIFTHISKYLKNMTQVERDAKGLFGLPDTKIGHITDIVATWDRQFVLPAMDEHCFSKQQLMGLLDTLIEQTSQGEDNGK